MKKKPKKLLCIFLTILILLVPIWYFNNYTIKITKQTIYSSKVKEDIEIAVISDLHGTSFGDENSMLINKIKTISPDIIFVLGDMYSKNMTDKIGQTVDLIKALSEITSVYVVTGEHDTDEEYKDKLLKLENVRLLDYSTDEINIGGTEICIYGINNVYFSTTFDLNKEFDKPDESKLNILLAHIPSDSNFNSFNVDLIFSGDTHGGMIRLPYFGGLYFKGYILPKLTYSGTITDKGLYQLKNKQLFVTSGLGNYPIPLRFNNRPEICSITISKGE